MILKKHFWKKIDVYNRNLFYDEKNKDLFDSNQYALFGENGTTIDYQYFANLNRKITFNNKNNLNNYTVSEDDSALLKELIVEIVDLLFNKNSKSLVSNENVFFDETKTTIDYYFKSPSEKQIVFNNKNILNNYTVSENDSALLKEIVAEVVDLLFNKNSDSLVSNENVFFDETKTTIDYYFKSPAEKQIVFNGKNNLNNYTVSENDSALLKEIVAEVVDLLFNKNSNSLVSNENVFFDETKTTIDYYFKSPVENKIVFNSKNKLNDYVVSEENTILLKEITTNE